MSGAKVGRAIRAVGARRARAVDGAGPANAHGHSDGHDHAHGHDHSHPHDHPHVHAIGPRTRKDLERGEGKDKLLFLDAPSGLAGDMTIAALVDLGVPERVIEEAIAPLGLSGFRLSFGARTKSGIVGTSFDVVVESAQPERTYGSIRRMLERSKLAPGVRAKALATFARLAESEAKVHRMPIDDVHFHEVGAVDAIVDVVGSAAALDWIGAPLVVSPLPMGHGRVKARHGILPLPPPAVVECLRGFPTYDAGIAFELVTPTGAAIVGAHATGASRWPSMVPERTGWGAGTANLADRANLLRAVLGSPIETTIPSPTPGSHVVLEANIDDASGELLGSWIETLLAEGALDAWAVPATMKKGRPAYVLTVLATAAQADALGRAILRETTSLGVRRHAVDRLERPRRMVHVATPYGPVAIKVSSGPFGRPIQKPEFSECLALAKTHGVPVRDVVLAASLAAEALETKPLPENRPHTGAEAASAMSTRGRTGRAGKKAAKPDRA